jgi:hypothetical protein
LKLFLNEICIWDFQKSTCQDRGSFFQFDDVKKIAKSAEHKLKTKISLILGLKKLNLSKINH